MRFFIFLFLIFVPFAPATDRPEVERCTDSLYQWGTWTGTDKLTRRALFAMGLGISAGIGSYIGQKMRTHHIPEISFIIVDPKNTPDLLNAIKSKRTHFISPKDLRGRRPLKDSVLFSFFKLSEKDKVLVSSIEVTGLSGLKLFAVNLALTISFSKIYMPEYLLAEFSVYPELKIWLEELFKDPDFLNNTLKKNEIQRLQDAKKTVEEWQTKLEPNTNLAMASIQYLKGKSPAPSDNSAIKYFKRSLYNLLIKKYPGDLSLAVLKQLSDKDDEEAEILSAMSFSSNDSNLVEPLRLLIEDAHTRKVNLTFLLIQDTHEQIIRILKSLNKKFIYAGNTYNGN